MEIGDSAMESVARSGDEDVEIIVGPLQGNAGRRDDFKETTALFMETVTDSRNNIVPTRSTGRGSTIIEPPSPMGTVTSSGGDDLGISVGATRDFGPQSRLRRRMLAVFPCRKIIEELLFARLYVESRDRVHFPSTQAKGSEQ